MLPTYAYRLYVADAADVASDLRRLAELDSQLPLRGRVVIGDIDGTPAAAIALADDRLIADPFVDTTGLTSLLRMRAESLRALQRTPDLRDRLLAGVRVRRAVASPA